MMVYERSHIATLPKLQNHFQDSRQVTFWLPFGLTTLANILLYLSPVQLGTELLVELIVAGTKFTFLGMNSLLVNERNQCKSDQEKIQYMEKMMNLAIKLTKTAQKVKLIYEKKTAQYYL